MDLERNRVEVGKTPGPAPPFASPLRAYLGWETVAVNRVLRARATRSPPVQMQLQGPVLPPGTQGHLQPRRQSQLHCEGRGR